MYVMEMSRAYRLTIDGMKFETIWLIRQSTELLHFFLSFRTSPADMSLSLREPKRARGLNQL